MINNGNVTHLRPKQPEHELAKHFSGIEHHIKPDATWRVIQRALGAVFIFACLAAVWAAAGAPGIEALGLSK